MYWYANARARQRLLILRCRIKPKHFPFLESVSTSLVKCLSDSGKASSSETRDQEVLTSLSSQFDWHYLDRAAFFCLVGQWKQSWYILALTLNISYIVWFDYVVLYILRHVSHNTLDKKPTNSTRLIRMGCIKLRGCRMCEITATETHREKDMHKQKWLCMAWFSQLVTWGLPSI